MRSAATTQAVATIGSSATIHPVTPAPAIAIQEQVARAHAALAAADRQEEDERR